MVIAAATAPMAAAKSRRLLDVFAGAGPVIDFLEQLEVLSDVGVLRIERERLLVGFARLGELPFVLVGDGEIVERGRVRGIDLDGALPSIDGLAPEPFLRDVDAEVNLRLRLGAGVGERGRRRHGRDEEAQGREARLHDGIGAHYTRKRASDVPWLSRQNRPILTDLRAFDLRNAVNAVLLRRGCGRTAIINVEEVGSPHKPLRRAWPPM